MKIFFLTLWSVFCLKSTELERRQILENKIEVLIPKDFTLMSKEMLDLKYRGQNKPTLVFTNDEATVNIAFNYLSNPASEDQIEIYQGHIKSSFENSFPLATWKGDGVKEIDGKKLGYLKLITDAVDQKVYNYVFLLNVDGRLLMGTFNCIEKLLPEWEDTSEEIVQSLRLSRHTEANPGR